MQGYTRSRPAARWPTVGSIAAVHLAVAAIAAVAAEKPAVRAFTDVKPPPGVYRTSWVGNTFGGNGGPNGEGYWVQNGAAAIAVTPDGTVIAGLEWDEAGRCAGLYKDGHVNRVLLQAKGDSLPDSAWGWGTGNNALAAVGDQILIASTGKKLLRFRWKIGDLNSAAFVEAVDMPDKAVGLAARGELVVAVYSDRVELRKLKDLSVLDEWDLKGARDAAIADDGSLWVLTEGAVRHRAADGRDLGVVLPDLQKPSSVGFDPRGRLVVTDDGPRQQVLIYDVSGKPTLMNAFGEKGGLLSGVSGEVAPKKLFALRGAGFDAEGNLYVGMSFGNGPAGNLIIRSFAPDGALRWEVISTAFVDGFGFDPTSDGAVIFSRTAMFDLDLTKTEPGSEWKLKAITLDHINRADDPRLKYGGSMFVRRPQGRRVLYSIGQYAGGYRIYVTGENDFTAREVDRIVPKKDEGEQWAWDVDESGAIWHGDAPGKRIRRYPFQAWREGKPVYDWNKPQSWPWPEGWDAVRRVRYDEATDSLYLSGYLKGERIETWGVVGNTVRRYDDWVKGTPSLRWTIQTPHDGNTDAKEGPLSPSSMAAAGDYLFFGMVKPTNKRMYVHIYKNTDGAYAGSFEPGRAVVDNLPGVGWLDMPYAMQALKRKNGEYLLLVEEDWRGKNLLYRWMPEGK
jgi:hypothetical protein